ncbi:MAG: hypothetical protein HYU51_16150 [Candidatus Rokubacteria bacterium]|nr:hypothetical protein [Candidatus Rokubacteria bacterium]
MNSRIEAGRKLLEELDRQGARVGSAFWSYDIDADEWRLVLSMPMVERLGVRAAYDHITRALKAAGIQDLYLRQIAAVSPHERIVASLSGAIRTRSELRVSRSVVGDEWIEGAYVYRST